MGGLVAILVALGVVVLLALAAAVIVLIRGDDQPTPLPASEQPGQNEPLALRVGGRAKVVAAGDDRHGEVGIVKALLNEDDGNDVVLRFVDGDDVFAFQRDEVVAVPRPNAVEAT